MRRIAAEPGAAAVLALTVVVAPLALAFFVAQTDPDAQACYAYTLIFALTYGVVLGFMPARMI